MEQLGKQIKGLFKLIKGEQSRGQDE